MRAAERELTRYASVTEGRITPQSKNLLREIVYTNPYFREGGLVDERGFLVYSTVGGDRSADPDPEPSSARIPRSKGCSYSGWRRPASCRRRPSSWRCRLGGQGEVNLLLDPRLLSLFFEDVALDPDGSLSFTGPKGGVLRVLGRSAAERS